MTVQHEYRGIGSPVGVVVAPVNSHYTDEEADEAWFCVFSDGVTSEWRRMAVDDDIADNTGSTDPVLYMFLNPVDVLLAAGTVVQLGFGGPIYSSVALAGDPLSFTADTLCQMSLRRVEGGGARLIVTPLTEYN